ncbi:unnamed protein product [Ilex paraguariensis]
MEEVTEEDQYEATSQSSLTLGVNFDIEEEQPHDQISKSKDIGSCLACGNCLAGCPYNAKLSTDKTYLVSALQAGCTIKTECQVQYGVRNPDDTCKEKEKICRKRRHLWLVFLNETDYVTSDFVVLSAGVFGTSNILFRSQMRGLKISERLGSGLSCNGNAVAYLAGSSAPLNAFGLNSNQFSKMPFQQRPGPAISSSYTSSLGFTIQGAVLPTAYPYLLFKGIGTYGWPPGYWLFHGIIDNLKHAFGSKRQAMVLNAMGYDDSDGKIIFDKNTSTIGFQPPHDPLLPRKIDAFQKLTKKLGGILFMSKHRSTSVHLLAAEHVSRHLVQDVLKFKTKEGTEFANATLDQKLGSIISGKFISSQRSVVVVKETMRGHMGGMPCTASLILKLNCRTSRDSDKMSMDIGKPYPLLRGKVGGYVEIGGVEKDNLHIIEGEVDLCEVDIRTLYTQYMHYHLLLGASSGASKVTKNTPREEMVNLKGKLHISVIELLKIVMSLKGNSRGKFVGLLLQSLFRTYVLQIPRGSCKYFITSEVSERPYPCSALHEIKTEDGFIISCKQWKCSQRPWRLEGVSGPYPILLINGYSIENYWLQTEPNDLVRTLLEEGHEIWLLQPRFHPSNSSIHFTIKDIGRFDIPAAINKILELHGALTKVHVIAHCVGGLSIHIALMGGHVSASQIASLSCTNSSMFFKLTALSIVNVASAHPDVYGDIRQEQVPASLPNIEGQFSTPAPQINSPFPATLREIKICNSGFIVDSNGKNSYLIHPERMALPTLYISGGRTLLVTPQTSFLANKYMKLHQPAFRHEWVVVEGFGHSDLLVGEESCKRVFPHIISHIKQAEKERNGAVNPRELKKCSREALAWSDDLYEERNGGLGSWISLLVTIWLVLLLIALLISKFF